MCELGLLRKRERHIHMGTHRSVLDNPSHHHEHKDQYRITPSHHHEHKLDDQSHHDKYKDQYLTTRVNTTSIKIRTQQLESSPRV